MLTQYPALAAAIEAEALSAPDLPGPDLASLVMGRMMDHPGMVSASVGVWRSNSDNTGIVETRITCTMTTESGRVRLYLILPAAALEF